MKPIMIRLSLLIGLPLILAGCAHKNNPASAIEAYIQALVAKDANKLTSLSCANWEGQAQVELDSFASVGTTLNGLKCQEKSQDGSYTLVTCEGKIIADYNGEKQEINLADRIYKAIQEGGEWRMCGYQ